MAIKDWKKGHRTESFFASVEEDFGEEYYPLTASIVYFKNKKTSGEIDIVENAPGYSIWIDKEQTKSFKTKSEALKYAKAYMKKH